MNLFACLMPIFLVIKPVFGFILAAKGCRYPCRFLERIIVLPETMRLGRCYLIKPGKKVTIWGKTNRRTAQIHRAMR